MQYALSSKRTITAVAKALKDWRSGREAAWNQGYIFNDPELLLPEAVVTTISRAAESINNLADLESCVRARWAGFEEFGEETLQILLDVKRALQRKDGIPIRGKKKVAGDSPPS